jgi:oxygen-independent coproporphyrinogen III oxidase
MTELALYLHIPFCRRRCHYCSFVSFAGREADINAYTRALIGEIRLRVRQDSELRSIYFGGGTPSLLTPAEVLSILTTILELYPLQKGTEVTLEANPGTVDGAYLKAIKDAGVNRLSLGVQSMDEEELKLLGRLHSVAEAKAAVAQAREAGFDNLSLDFIYGIPGRELSAWRGMLDEIIKLGAEHLSLYALTLEEETPMGRAVARGEMAAPDPDQAANEYELAEELLEISGYMQYEISNWARPGHESRHNLAYWQGVPYLGVGVAAHSFLDGKRVANTESLDDYLEALGKGRLPAGTSEVIDCKTGLSEAIIVGLRLNEGISVNDIEERFKVNLGSLFGPEIVELEELGLLQEAGGRLRLTARGRLLGNEVFLRFLP